MGKIFKPMLTKNPFRQIGPNILPVLFFLIQFQIAEAAPSRNWTRMGSTETVTLYMDRNAIEKKDNIRSVWEMQDLKQADSDGVRSRVYYNQYDCQNKYYRISRMTSYAGAKQTGQVLFELPEVGYWHPIPAAGLFVLNYIALCVK
jgi:hypothetical protein